MTSSQNLQLSKRLKQIATMAQKFLERLEMAPAQTPSSASKNEENLKK